jgi:WD40 repeat protein
MPTYNGHKITSTHVNLKSAKLRDPPTEANQTPEIKVPDAYNVRTANKHIVLTYLTKCLTFSKPISCFDVSIVTNILLVCCARTIFVFNTETNILKEEVFLFNKMGKTGGAVHRGDIRCCAVDIKGQLAVTGGEDKRIIIWDLQTWKSIKYFILIGLSKAIKALFTK